MQRRLRSFSLFAALLAVIGLGASAVTVPAAGQSAQVSSGRWADAATATITPGVQMYTEGAQCTANFVFTDKRKRVYLGYAAHCAGLGSSTDTDGCTTGSLPLGTPVTFASGGNLFSDGTTLGKGRLAYSSWEAMQRAGTTHDLACAYNDFALVRVLKRDVAKVNPSVPFWGGPTRLSKSGAPSGSRVYSWGQSSLRPTTVLSPREGLSLGGAGGGWSWLIYTVSPGVPGDSGSGFLDADGAALGVLSTLEGIPPGANGVGDLRTELAFARSHSKIPRLRLVRGTEAFAPLP